MVHSRKTETICACTISDSSFFPCAVLVEMHARLRTADAEPSAQWRDLKIR
jgi:hypothetical protein